MDGQRFDQLTRLMGSPKSRRETIKFFAAGIGAAFIGIRSRGSVEAGSCRDETYPCIETADCCGELVCTYGACYGAGGCSEEDSECGSNDDCCGYLACVDGYCAQWCSFETQECEVEEDCCGYLVCADDDSCQLCSLTGDSCSTDTDCCDDRTCSDGFCVSAEVPAGHATITIHKATCHRGVGANIFEECHGNVLGGVDFAIDGFEIGSGTITTDANGVASHTILEAAAEGDVTLTEDSGVLAGYASAYVFCSEQNSGTVLYDGDAPSGSVTIFAEQGDDIVCDWYNITKGSDPGPTPTPKPGGVTTLPSTGEGRNENDGSIWPGAAMIGGAAAVIAATKLRQGRTNRAE